MTRLLLVVFALSLVATAACSDDPVYWQPDDVQGGDVTDEETAGGDATGDDTGESDVTDGDTTGGDDTGDVEENDASDGEDDAGDGEDDTGDVGPTGPCSEEQPENCFYACAPGVEAWEVFADGQIVGCVGSVTWEDRATLCGGYRVALPEEFLELYDGKQPTNHYWTEASLDFIRAEQMIACAVERVGAPFASEDCAISPGRVCAPVDDPGLENIDAAGNLCAWSSCVFNEDMDNRVFGGCALPGEDADAYGNYPSRMAGTLCIMGQDADHVTPSADVDAHRFNNGDMIRGNLYVPANNDRWLAGFQQQLTVNDHVCEVFATVWGGPRLDPEGDCEGAPAPSTIYDQIVDWEVLHFESLGHFGPGTYFLGPSDLWIDLKAGDYYGLALSWWDCNAYNEFYYMAPIGFPSGLDLVGYTSGNLFESPAVDPENFYPPWLGFCDEDVYLQSVYTVAPPR